MATDNPYPSTIPAPPTATRFVDELGNITPVWYRFLLTLFLRTNGPDGPSLDVPGLLDLALTTEDRDYQEAILQALIAAPSAQDPTLQTAIALLAATATQQEPQFQDLAQSLALHTSQQQSSWDYIASLLASFSQNDPQSNSFAEALAAQTENQQQPAAPEIAVTLGASPATYTAYCNGSLIISGGTVSQIDISRDGGSTYYTTGLTAGQFLLANGDIAQVTYTVAPTTQVFLPF